MLKRFLSMVVLLTFFITSVVGPNCAYAQGVFLPEPGTMVPTSPAYVPVILKGLTVHADNPLLFDFIVDTGNSGLKAGADDAAITDESQKLVKYFLASLTLPEKDQWVNLSPYEDNRVLPEELGRTELGRDMLAQDYVLKQITASLMYPEKELGKAFWAQVYERAQKEYGTTEIPVDTFNKVWIVADKADVYVKKAEQGSADGGQNGLTAFVVGSHLKVMLESDYVAQQEAGNKKLEEGFSSGIQQPASSSQELSQQVIREIVIPELEKEVNTGKNFSNLRQIFHSMILATWYKKNLKDALLTQVYANHNKTDGVEGSWVGQKGADIDPEQIWGKYVEAYQKGVFNFIREDVDRVTGEAVPHKYFSGGVAPNLGIDLAMNEVPTTSGLAVEGTLLLEQVGLNRANGTISGSVLPSAPSLGKQGRFRTLWTDLEMNKLSYQDPLDPNTRTLGVRDGRGELIGNPFLSKYSGLSAEQYDVALNVLAMDMNEDETLRSLLRPLSFSAQKNWSALLNAYLKDRPSLMEAMDTLIRVIADRTNAPASADQAPLQLAQNFEAMLIAAIRLYDAGGFDAAMSGEFQPKPIKSAFLLGEIQAQGSTIEAALTGRLVASYSIEGGEKFKSVIMNGDDGKTDLQVARDIATSGISAKANGDLFYALKVFVAVRVVLYQEFNAKDRYDIPNDSVEEIIKDFLGSDRKNATPYAQRIVAAYQKAYEGVNVNWAEYQGAFAKLLTDADSLFTELKPAYAEASKTVAHQNGFSAPVGNGNGNGNGVKPSETSPEVVEAQPAGAQEGKSVDLAFPENPVVQDVEYQKNLRVLIRSFWSITGDQAREDLIFQALTATTDGKAWASLEAKLLPNQTNINEVRIEKLKADRQERIALFAVLFALARQPLVGKTVRGQSFQDPIVSRPSVTFVSKVRGQLLASNNPDRFAKINDMTLSPTFAAQFSSIPFDAILQKVTEAFGEFKEKKPVGNGPVAATATAAVAGIAATKPANGNGDDFTPNEALTFEDNLKARAKGMLQGLSEANFEAVWTLVQRGDLTTETLVDALKGLGITFTPANKTAFATLRALYQGGTVRPAVKDLRYKPVRFAALMNLKTPDADQRLEMVIPGLRETARSVLSAVNTAGIDAAMGAADMKGDLISVANSIREHLTTLEGYPEYLKEAYRVGDVKAISERTAEIVEAIDTFEETLKFQEQSRLLGEWMGIDAYLLSLVSEALGQVAVIESDGILSQVKPEPLKFARRERVPSGLIVIPNEMTFAGAATEPPDAAMAGRKTIVLVDDDADLLSATVEMLKISNPGAKFVKAASGSEAIRVMEGMPAEERAGIVAVYSDTDMKDGDGFSVAEYVAKNFPVDVRYVAKSGFMTKEREAQYRGVFAEQAGRVLDLVSMPQDIPKLMTMKLEEDFAMVELEAVDTLKQFQARIPSLSGESVRVAFMEAPGKSGVYFDSFGVARSVIEIAPSGLKDNIQKVYLFGPLVVVILQKEGQLFLRVTAIRNAGRNGDSLRHLNANTISGILNIGRLAGGEDIPIQSFQERKGTIGIMDVQQGGLTTPVALSRIAQQVLDDEQAARTNGATAPGGIDLNAGNMTLNEQGEPIDFKFDPAVTERFRNGDFTGITPVILNITPIPSLAPLLGMETGTVQPENV